jgi:hypothetical protein
MRKSLIILSLSIATAAVTPPALAQEPDRADEFMRRGIEAGNRGAWPEGVGLLRQAWELKQSYDIAANLGLGESRVGAWRGAAEHLSFALSTFPANGKPEHKKLITESLAKAKAETAELTVTVNQPGARVTVDGELAGTSPFRSPIFVDPGTRNLVASLAGFSDARQSVMVTKGSAQAITLVLARSDAPPTVVPSRRLSPLWIVAGGVLAVGGLGVGIGATVAANGKADDVKSLGANVAPGACAPPNDTRPDCTSLRTAAQGQGSAQNVAEAGYIIGGVFALATAGLLVWRLQSVDSTPAASFHVEPAVGRAQQGFVFGGSF